MLPLPSQDLSGRTEVPSFTSDGTELLTAASVAGSVNLRAAVIAEGKSRRLATVLMLMAMAAEAEPQDVAA